MKHKIICGASEVILKEFEENSFDSCVTDPPYGLEFMGKDWDRLSGGFSNGEFKGFRLPQIFGGNRNIKCPDCGKWIYDHYPRNCTYGGVERYKSREMSEWYYRWATELHRVMKPGAHILVFGGTRTYHRMACAAEDAGFEVRDMINWIYGSGFPKSLDISKQLDKMKGKEQEIVGKYQRPNGTDRTYENWESNNKISVVQNKAPSTVECRNRTAPTTKEAIQWNRWGTGLKPAHEPILLGRKPISERNIASNVLKWGVGGINVDGCRIRVNKEQEPRRKWEEPSGQKEYDVYPVNTQVIPGLRRTSPLAEYSNKGRFPANLILECCCEDTIIGICKDGRATPSKGDRTKGIYGKWEGNKVFFQHGGKCIIHTNPNCVCRMLDEQSGESESKKQLMGTGTENVKDANIYGKYMDVQSVREHNDKGGSSRFFYQAKASQNERYFYCRICKQAYPMKERDKHIHNAPDSEKYKYLEFHPTQKPLQLIQYLVRLITPSDGTVLDPFMGTGTTLLAAEKENFNSTGIDSKSDYCKIAETRLREELIQQKIIGERSTIKKTGF